MFDVWSVDRKITHVNFGWPEVIGNESIYEQFTLKEKIFNRKFFGPSSPSLSVNSVAIEP